MRVAFCITFVLKVPAKAASARKPDWQEGLHRKTLFRTRSTTSRASHFIACHIGFAAWRGCTNLFMPNADPSPDTFGLRKSSSEQFVSKVVFTKEQIIFKGRTAALSMLTIMMTCQYAIL